ncbi:MAG: porphobilinogen synthase [Armatimonadetes bacterium]|nr:porphobilinogen synthase [Armatimonadota bacterium]
MPDRLRRLRKTPQLRSLFRETEVSASDFIYPIFVSETATGIEPIESMPGQSRLPLSMLANKLCEVESAGVPAVLFFGLPAHKDDRASASADSNGIVQQAIRLAKKTCPDLVVMTDVCVCAYTPHGHCGVLKGDQIDNDQSLELLAAMAVSHAQAGADVVAPSSMMDRQVGAIREGLDANGLQTTPIMAYSAKFASAFYGPFREAADSSPSFGDRSSYQHEPGNARHSRLELFADIDEGADILMVKPGLPYLDIVQMARAETDLPIAVYNVSGEYAMVKAAAERGWLDERRTVLEILTSFRRAGADLIITYHALEAAIWLNDN